MKIVVIGGTGLIGSKVVSKLTQLGHEAVAAAPNNSAGPLLAQATCTPTSGLGLDAPDGKALSFIL